MKHRTRALCVAGALISIAGSTPARAQAGAITQAVAIATFDTAWSKIDRTFYDTAFLAHRWKTLRDSLRPLAERAKTNAELRTVLQTLISSVGVSHFGLIPQEMSPALDDAHAVSPVSGEPGNAGLALRLAEGKLIAWKVDTGGPAWIAGVRPGDEIRKINQTAIANDVAQLAGIANESVRRQARTTAVMRANAQLSGSVGDTVRLDVGGAEKLATRTIVLGPVRGQMSRFGNLPPLNAIVDAREMAGPGSRRIGVISFSVWLPVVARDLDRAFEKLRGADGIVIDLRGNPGGVAGMVGGIAGHLLDSTYMIGTLVQRTQTLRLVANPRRVSTDAKPIEPFAGPVVILMDPLSGSTSEFFAAGLQGLGRARIVGETSAGAALPALMDRLPNGDVLMHVVADLTDSKGRRVEGTGVIPDELVPLKAKALASGHDEALEAALRWIAKQGPKQ
jgi:carboxyl-terminal processing protease